MLISVTGWLALTFVYFRGQDRNWDLLHYHYYSGYALLHGRFFTDIDIAPVAGGTFLNPLPNILAYTTLTFLPFPISAWVLTVLQLLSLPILVLIFQELSRDMDQPPGITGFLGLLLCLIAPLWWSVLGTTFFTSTLAPIVLLGLLLGMRGIGEIEKSMPAGRLLMISGIMFGFATGLKLTNAIFATGFMVALVLALSSKNKALIVRSGMVYFIGLTVGFAITAWWNILLLIQWDSPIFPLYNNLFESPYFAKITDRDLRWKFHSLWEFGHFLYSSALGTRKTMETPFADARLLMLATLLIPIFFLKYFYKYFSSKKEVFFIGGSVTRTFLLYFYISFVIWAVLFAYQRYVIPLELLYGAVIWILLVQIFRRRTPVSLILLACVFVSFITLIVPDWNHKPAVKGQPNVFGLQLPKDLIETPAVYLVSGYPNGYIYPFLHPDSRFIRIDFSPLIDNLILNALEQNSSRPVRFLTHEPAGRMLWDKLVCNGYFPDDNNKLFCWRFKSDIGRYVACEIRAEKSNLSRQKRSSTGYDS